jgi:hypothetical protein
VSNIFRADNSYIHQISNGPLIDSVTFSYYSSSLSVPRPAGLKGLDPYFSRVHLTVSPVQKQTPSPFLKQAETRAVKETINGGTHNTLLLTAAYVPRHDLLTLLVSV